MLRTRRAYRAARPLPFAQPQALFGQVQQHALGQPQACAAARRRAGLTCSGDLSGAPQRLDLGALAALAARAHWLLPATGWRTGALASKQAAWRVAGVSLAQLAFSPDILTFFAVSRASSPRLEASGSGKLTELPSSVRNRACPDGQALMTTGTCGVARCTRSMATAAR